MAVYEGSVKVQYLIMALATQTAAEQVVAIAKIKTDLQLQVAAGTYNLGAPIL